MKRYTGQQALYEAISRSQAKAKRGSILERLRPETPAVEEPKPPAGPAKAAAEAPQPPPKKSPEPAATEKKAVFEKKADKAADVKKVDPPPQKPDRAVVKPPVAESRLGEAIRKVMPPGPTWLRPKPLQLSAGRVEVSISYHIGVVVVLVVVLATLAAFRLGQEHPVLKNKLAIPMKSPVPTTKQNAVSTTDAGASKATQPDVPAPPARATEPVVQSQRADHCIVLLTQYKQSDDLAPVVEYFAKHDIDLRIVPLADMRKILTERKLNPGAVPGGDGFMLVTEYLYDNPQSPGTKGFAMRQKIVELGANYKAAQGKERFGSKPFSDAYGMRVQ